MKTKRVGFIVVAAITLVAVAFLLSGGLVAQDQAMPAGKMAASAPTCMTCGMKITPDTACAMCKMCCMNMCKQQTAKIDEATKALAAAKKAADSGDAKAASASIESASTLLKEIQESVKACEKTAAPAAAAGPTGAVVNGHCPITGKVLDKAKVPAELTREYKGKKVGFCCPLCPPAWDKLSDADKDKKLQDAMK